MQKTNIDLKGAFKITSDMYVKQLELDLKDETRSGLKFNGNELK